MSDKKYVAYEGVLYTIEWYFKENGRSPAKEYFDDLSEEQQDKLTRMWFSKGNYRANFSEQVFRNEGDKIFSFKPKPDRFLCFFYKGGKIIMTNAFEKKCQKLPLEEKKRALKYYQDYENRIKEGTYYE